MTLDPFRQEAAEQFRLGQLAMDREEYAEAVERFGEATRRCWDEPTYVQWYTRACEALKERTAQKKQEHADAVQLALRTQSAERYWIRGCKARRLQVWKEAVSCFEGAHALFPEHVEYAQALDDARAELRATSEEPGEAEEPQAEPEPEAPRSLAPRALLVAALALAAVGYVLPQVTPEPVPDLAAAYADLGPFERVHPVRSFGHTATLVEPAAGRTSVERLERCTQIANALPGEASLLLAWSDGYSVLCAAQPVDVASR